MSFRHVDPMARDNIYLCGDAAHIHSPVGGRGKNLGFEDACWLAWLVSEGRQAEYSDLRLPAARHVLAETRRNTGMALMRNPVALAARNVLMPLLGGLPWLRRESVRGALGLDTPSPPWLA
ncbi:FAD-dependent oxidoreductase [Rhizobiaceae sp. 2RAB30]